MEIGDRYGFRTWIEYGLKQAKDTLGWADFRMTRYEQIEKWWEMVMSAFLMVCLPTRSTIRVPSLINSSCSILGGTTKAVGRTYSTTCAWSSNR